MTRRALPSMLAAAALLLGGCEGASPPVRFERTAVPELRAHGLSGVTRGGEHVWAVAEERREIHRFDASFGSRTRLPLGGVAEGLELESAAWLGAGLLAVGTETEEERDADAVLLVRVGSAGADVVGQASLNWRRLFGRRAAPNRGIEGLCAGSTTVLAGAEWVLEEGGARLAPLARAPHDGAAVGAWQPLRLRLTSDVGKVSSLDCDDAPGGGLLVHAVERHYGVTRVLRFEVPATAQDAVLVPTIVFDVTSVARDVPNVEGLVVRSSALWMVSDHDPDDTAGTTELLTLSPLVAPRRVLPAGPALRSRW